MRLPRLKCPQIHHNGSSINHNQAIPPSTMVEYVSAPVIHCPSLQCDSIYPFPLTSDLAKEKWEEVVASIEKPEGPLCDSAVAISPLLGE